MLLFDFHIRMMRGSRAAGIKLPPPPVPRRSHSFNRQTLRSRRDQLYSPGNMPTFGPKTTTDEVIAEFGDRMRGKNSELVPESISFCARYAPSCSSMVRTMRHHQVIITGVSIDSIGYEVVRVLAPLVNLIVIVGRSEERCAA